MTTIGRSLFTSLLVALSSGVTAVRGDETARYDCRQARTETVVCSYRYLDSAKLLSARLALGNLDIAPLTNMTFLTTGEAVAVLFLVDTSDPARSVVIERNIEQIGRLADAAGSQHRLGLARFDSNLEVLAPLGSSPSEIRSAASGLSAVGKTTELYRSSIEAIRALDAYDAGRKVLFVLSDGLAEDYAYHHQDVIARAREAGVVIHGVGFARSIPQSVALQSLRRLAEESGGEFIRADDVDFTLPEAFFAAPYHSIDSGGDLTFDLSTALAAGLHGPQNALVSFADDGGTSSTLSVEIVLPPATTTVVEVSARAYASEDNLEAELMDAIVAVNPSRAPSVSTTNIARSPAAAPQRSSKLNTWLWYGTPAAFLLVVVIALMVYGWLFRRRVADTAKGSPNNKPFAYLMAADGKERFIISQTPWRIGRSKTNELTLSDHSVSRLHAEIRRNQDGSFTIADLDSLNGVFVNDKKVRSSELTEGDGVDVGDIGMKFTLYDDDSAAQEPTVMIRTHTP